MRPRQAAGLRVELDVRNEKINYKVREHSVSKVPVIVVCGRREAEEGTVNIRRLGEKDQKSMTLADAVAALQDAVEADPAAQITVDLDGRTVSGPAAPAPAGPATPAVPSAPGAPGAGRGLSVAFEIDDYTRWRLMGGLDDIALTLRNADKITGFERHRKSWLPVTS